MRLWHYKLIPVLPQKQLISQWRECIAIKRQWEKGTLKHPLVSYITNYDKNCFIAYTYRVILEMQKRGIKYNEKYLHEIQEFCRYGRLTIFNLEDYKRIKEHNKRYLVQCYYNLQEKYDRNIITKEEWNKIEEVYNGRYN